MITKNANHKSFCYFMIGDYLPKNLKRIGEGISRRDEDCKCTPLGCSFGTWDEQSCWWPWRLATTTQRASSLLSKLEGSRNLEGCIAAALDWQFVCLCYIIWSHHHSKFEECALDSTIRHSSFHKFPLMKKEGLYHSSFGHVKHWDKKHMSTCVLQNLTAGVDCSRSELLNIVSKNPFVEQHHFCACLLGSYIKHHPTLYLD